MYAWSRSPIFLSLSEAVSVLFDLYIVSVPFDNGNSLLAQGMGKNLKWMGNFDV